MHGAAQRPGPNPPAFRLFAPRHARLSRAPGERGTGPATLLRDLLTVARRLRLAATQRHRLAANAPDTSSNSAVWCSRPAWLSWRTTTVPPCLHRAGRSAPWTTIPAISPYAGAVVASGPLMSIRTEKCKALAPALSASLIGQKTTQIPLRVTHETAHVPPVLNLLQQAALNAAVAKPQNVSARMTHQNR